METPRSALLIAILGFVLTGFASEDAQYAQYSSEGTQITQTSVIVPMPGTDYPGSLQTGVFLPTSNCDWTGTWTEGGQIDAPSTMTLHQSGDRVDGTYTHNNGEIHGKISGKTLTGTWAERSIGGTFEFTISDDCNSFSGTYTDSSGSLLTWTGTRNAPSDGDSDSSDGDGFTSGIYYIYCLGHIEGPRWLDGRTHDGTVGLAPSIVGGYTGTRWEINEIEPGVYTIYSLGHIEGPRWLDGRTHEGTVGLAPTTTGGYTGTRWKITEIEPNVYTIYCLGHIEGPRWLDGRTHDGSAGLAPTTTGGYTGTRWRFFKE